MKIADENLLKRTIELKQRLTDLMIRENKITYYEDDDECSSDSDMEVVPAVSADDLLLAQCSRAESTIDDVHDLIFFFSFISLL
jgi:hypothetical protein